MKHVIDKLIRKGLNEYEAKVYVQLIQQDRQPAQYIALQCNIPRTKVYVVLKSLIEKGMCYEIKGKKKLYNAIHPVDAMDGIVRNLKYEYEDAQEIAQDLAQIFAERENEKNQKTDFEFEILHTPNLIYERILKYTLESRKVVRSMEKPPYAIKNINEDETILIIPMKSIVQESELSNEYTYKRCKIESKQGKQIRIMKDVPLKYVIFDDKHLLLPSKNLETNKIKESIIINNPDVINYFIKTFDEYFKKSMSFEDYDRKKRRTK